MKRFGGTHNLTNKLGLVCFVFALISNCLAKDITQINGVGDRPEFDESQMVRIPSQSIKLLEEIENGINDMAVTEELKKSRVLDQLTHMHLDLTETSRGSSSTIPTKLDHGDMNSSWKLLTFFGIVFFASIF